MKFNHCWSIFLLFSTIHAYSRSFDNDEENDQMNEISRRHDFQHLHSRADNDFFVELQRALEAERREEKKEPVLNVTVVQRGLYLASVKINFLRNGLQDEFESDSITDGHNRVFLLQNNSSDVIDHVRIRLSTVSPHKTIGDFQLVHPAADQLCYVLSGTIFSPVYSLCALGENYARRTY